MELKIALAGNPNCGKTTLFNALTGSNQYVGNWPGVTVEKKEGRLKGQKDVIIQDLPGIYLRTDNSYPRTFNSMGSPRGATLRMKISVPLVMPISMIRRFTAPSPWSFATVTVSPTLASFNVFMLFPPLHICCRAARRPPAKP